MKLSFDREWWNTQQITKSCCTYKPLQPWNAEWQRQHGQTRHSLRDGAGKSSLSPRCSQLGWEMLLKALINPSQPATIPSLCFTSVHGSIPPHCRSNFVEHFVECCSWYQSIYPTCLWAGWAENSSFLRWAGPDWSFPELLIFLC